MSHLDKKRGQSHLAVGKALLRAQSKIDMFWVRKEEWLGSEEEVTWGQKTEKQRLNPKVPFRLGECIDLGFSSGSVSRLTAGELFTKALEQSGTGQGSKVQKG